MQKCLYILKLAYESNVVLVGYEDETIRPPKNSHFKTIIKQKDLTLNLTLENN